MKNIIMISVITFLAAMSSFAEDSSKSSQFDNRQDAFIAGYNDGYAQGTKDSHQEHKARREQELAEAYEQGRQEGRAKTKF